MSGSRIGILFAGLNGCGGFVKKLCDPGIGVGALADCGTENPKSNEEQCKKQGKPNFMEKMRMTVAHKEVPVRIIITNNV